MTKSTNNEFVNPGDAMRARLADKLFCRYCTHFTDSQTRWCRQSRYAPEPEGIQLKNAVCAQFKLTTDERRGYKDEWIISAEWYP